MNEDLKLVFVGHVDHGKSTLIGRLLYETDSLPAGKMDEIRQICEELGRDVEFGYILDVLEEERSQGVTIDTTQIFFRTKKRSYTIIDAPGHVEFIKNMITGASQAEAAILIVDAGEGVREQTRRHAYILSMLGLDQVIVVINKMDMVEYKKSRYDVVKEDILGFLKAIRVFPNYVIPISAKEGDNVTRRSSNMGWYDGPTILEALDSFKAGKSFLDMPVRFSVQDVYNYDERIVVGRVESGIFRVDDVVTILPTKEKTVIKKIVEFMKDNVKFVEAGKATGFILADKLYVERGYVISGEKDIPIATNILNGYIFWLDNTPYSKGERLKLKIATQETSCIIEKIKSLIDSSSLRVISQDADRIEKRQVADVVIKTSKPVIIDNFNSCPALGRFVLERASSVAGGIITQVR